MRSFYTVPADLFSALHASGAPKAASPATPGSYSGPARSGPRSAHSNRRLSAKGTRQNLATCSVFLQAGLTKHQLNLAPDLSPVPQTDAHQQQPSESLTTPPRRPSQAPSQLGGSARRGRSQKGSIVPAAPRRSSHRHFWAGPDPAAAASSGLLPVQATDPAQAEDPAQCHTDNLLCKPKWQEQDSLDQPTELEASQMGDGQLWVQCEMCNKWRLMPAEHQVRVFWVQDC